MSDKKPKIFISSTFRDLSEYRLAVKDAILQIGCTPVLLEQLPATGRAIDEIINEQLTGSDAVILLVGHRYGTVVSETGKGWLEKEYEAIKRQKKPLLVFLQSDDAPRLKTNIDEDQTKIKQFRDRLVSDRIVRFFSNPEDLKISLVTALTPLLRVLKEETGPKEYKLLFGATAPVEDRRALISALLFFDKLLVLTETRKIPSSKHPYFDQLSPYAESGLISFIKVQDLLPTDDPILSNLSNELFRQLAEHPIVIDTATGDVLDQAELRTALDDLAIDILFSRNLGIPFRYSGYFRRIISAFSKLPHIIESSGPVGFWGPENTFAALGIDVIESFGGTKDLSVLTPDNILQLRKDASFYRYRRWISKLAAELQDVRDIEKFNRLKEEIYYESKLIKKESITRRLSSYLSLPLVLIPFPSLSSITQALLDMAIRYRDEKSPLRFPAIVGKAVQSREEA